MMEDMKDIKFDPKPTGWHFRNLRKEKGLGRDDISKLTGLNIVYINLIERGKKSISFTTAMKFSKALNFPILDLEEYVL